MNIRRIVALTLQAVGLLALLGVIAVGVLFYRVSRGYAAPPVSFNRSELESTLNLAGVDKAQAWSIIASSKSSRSLGGDHLDWACIQLEHFDLEPPSAGQHWERGAETDPMVLEAMKMALESARQEGGTCMPEAPDANSDRFVRNLWRTTFSNRIPTAAIVFFYEHASRRLFFIDFST